MRKLIVLFASLVLLCSSALAQNNFDFSAVAPSGQTLYYKIIWGGTSNVEVVPPNGNNYSAYTGYTSPTGSLTIPSSVSNNGNTYSVTRIGERAFALCHGLTSVVIPNSVTIIGNQAFIGCGLPSITIPNSVTYIGYNAFDGVRHVEYHGSATGAPWRAYSMNGVTDGDFVFSNSNNDTLIAYLGTGSAVTIPSSVTTISNRVFCNCSGLNSVIIPNSVTSIGEYAFQNCRGLTSITIPSSVTSIGMEAFSFCSGLTSVTISEGVTSIGDFVFSGCSGLTSVTIPSSVTSICENAFSGCSGLTSVTIPSSVTSIGYWAFDGCSSLATTIYTGTVAQWCNITFGGYVDNPLYYSHSLTIDGVEVTGYSNILGMNRRYDNISFK